MRMHRLTLVTLLALGTALAVPSITSAQSTNAPAAGARRGSVQQRVDRMASELDLTADQKTKVTALIEEETKKRQELRADTTQTREEKREKLRGMMEDQEKKLKTILTPEQAEKWQKIREQFRPRQPQAQPADKKPQP